MATFFFTVSNPISQPFAFASFRATAFFNPPPLSIYAAARKRRGTAVAARAGPSTKSILFAIALPSSLLAVTIFAALRMGDKLDQEWREEVTFCNLHFDKTFRKKMFNSYIRYYFNCMFNFPVFQN